MTGYIFDACDNLPQTGDAYSTEEKHGGTDRSVVCSPVRARQLREDDIHDSGFCFGLSNVVFVCEASV